MTDITRIGSSAADPCMRDEEAAPATSLEPPKSPSRRQTPAVPRDAASLPPLPDTNGDLLARAVRNATARPLLAMGVSASDVTPDRDAAVKQRIDAFLASTTATFRVPGEGDVTVAAAFRMPYPTRLTAAEKLRPSMVAGAARERQVITRQPEVRAIAAKARLGDVSAVYFGHGSPAQVQALTQGLIDAGKLPNGPEPTALRIRTMMTEYGIGFDCAGFAQQGFLAGRGLTRAQVGFASGAKIESLSDLPSLGFRKIAPEDARAGDILVMDGPPREVGHRILVNDRRDLSASDVAALRTRSYGLGPGARVSELTLDSSWGSGGDPRFGGVLQVTWYYDADSGRWGHPGPGGAMHFDDRPYFDDRLRGVYHFPEGK